MNPPLGMTEDEYLYLVAGRWTVDGRLSKPANDANKITDRQGGCDEDTHLL